MCGVGVGCINVRDFFFAFSVMFHFFTASKNLKIKNESMAELVKASGSPVGTPPRLMISKMVSD